MKPVNAPSPADPAYRSLKPLGALGALGKIWTLAVVQAQLNNQGDAWVYTVDQLARLLEAIAPGSESAGADEPPVERMQVLARRVAELHVALAQRTGAPAFDPEPITPPNPSLKGSNIFFNAPPSDAKTMPVLSKTTRVKSWAVLAISSQCSLNLDP